MLETSVTTITIIFAIIHSQPAYGSKIAKFLKLICPYGVRPIKYHITTTKSKKLLVVENYNPK